MYVEWFICINLSLNLHLSALRKKYIVKYRLTSVRKAFIKKTRDKCWWGCGEKGTLVYYSRENKLVQPLQKMAWRVLKKLNRAILWSSNPTSGHLFKGDEISISTRFLTLMFIAVLFTIAKIRKQHKCPCEWIKKMLNVTHTRNIIQPQKRRKSWHSQQHGWIWRTLC